MEACFLPLRRGSYPTPGGREGDGDPENAVTEGFEIQSSLPQCFATFAWGENFR